MHRIAPVVAALGPVMPVLHPIYEYLLHAGIMTVIDEQEPVLVEEYLVRMTSACPLDMDAVKTRSGC